MLMLIKYYSLCACHKLENELEELEYELTISSQVQVW